MGQILKLRNAIQQYAWGSPTAIPELLDLPTSNGLPCAELWMGAHPSAPSRVIEQGQPVRLDLFIQRNPEKILGRVTAETFGNTLPFLFKVLAAARPLSIQAHPDISRAREGFLREDREGIPPDSPLRNYRDANHKPECLFALTPFSLLCGFRPLADILAGFSAAMPATSRQWLVDMTGSPENKDLKRFFQRLLDVKGDAAGELIAAATEYAQTKAAVDPACRWILLLHQYFPDDIMVLAPLFLNLVELAPRQAVFFPPGVLHSYLEGVGIELMASSDNVLRGGLTSKHVDADELMRVLDFTASAPRLLSPAGEGCERVYESGAAEFVLSEIRVTPGAPCRPAHQGRASILLCTEGEAVITETAGGDRTVVSRGESVLVPASVEEYALSGEALLYKAAVPDPAVD